MRLFFSILICGTLTVLPLVSALAQASPYQSDPIVVEDQNATQSIEKPSAFTTVLYPEDYQEQFLTLPELLKNQVGIFVKGFGGLGQLSTVTIRGSTAEQVSVFIDGVKLNTAQGGAVDFSTIPLGAIAKIEIIRGGATARFGSDAIGGVINIITKEAGEKRQLQFKASGGSFLSFETNAGYSEKFGKVGLTLNHHHLSSNGDFSFISTGIDFEGGGNLGGGEEFKRIHNGFFSEGFLARVDAKISPKHQLHFTNDFFYTTRDEPGPELETTQFFPNNPLDAHRNLLRNTTGLTWVWQDMGVKNLQYSLTPSYQIESNHFENLTPALGGPIDVTFVNQSFSLKSEWIYEADFKQHNHVFTLMHEARFLHFDDDSPLEGAPLSGTQTRHIQALFFEDEISLLNEKLIFNPSVRWEYASDFDSNVAAHFGIVGKPTSWLTLKTNVENSFRYPNFNELFFPDQGFIRGNPELKKESAFNFDIGARIQHKWAWVEFSYFLNDIENSIVFVPISTFTIAPVNTSEVLAQGFEFAFGIKPVKFFEIGANYTYLDASFKASDKQLPGRPKHLFNGNIQFNWKHGGVFTRVHYIDQLPLDFANTKFLRDRTLVDVGGVVKFKDHYFLSLEIKNIGNVQSSDSLGFPLPRRSAFVSFGYRS